MATGPENLPGPTDSGSEIAAALGRLTRLRTAWAGRGTLCRLGLDPVRLGPEWFAPWPTWQRTYYVATPIALERAGLVVDELDDRDKRPRYMRSPEVPRAFHCPRERGRAYGVDLDRLKAPPAERVLTYADGSPVKLWGRTVRVDGRMGHGTPAPKGRARKAAAWSPRDA